MPLGIIVVPGDSDLEMCRTHIERLQEVRCQLLEEGEHRPLVEASFPRLKHATLREQSFAQLCQSCALYAADARFNPWYLQVGLGNHGRTLPISVDNTWLSGPII